MVKTMNLTVKERLLIGAFLPQKGSLRDQRIVKEVARKVTFTPDERTALEMTNDERGIHWNGEKGTELAIELNDDEREFLKRQIGRLDEEEAFTQDLLALADRIKEL